MSPPAPEVPWCLHCERSPRAGGSVLCADCGGRAAVRVLYERRRSDRPADWEEHLRRLTARASAGLPLFDDP